MPKPTNKKALLNACHENYDLLKQFIAELDSDSLYSDFPQGTMNRNVRDVLYHLHKWHLLFLSWYDIGKTNLIPKMPTPNHKWNDIIKLNKEIWQESQGFSLVQVSEDLDESFKKMIRVIETHTDKELFTKQYYKWTKSTSLAAYIISNSSSHYLWGYKLIKKAIRT